MIALRDEETQLKGVVFILNSVGHPGFFEGRPAKFAEVLSLTPLRYAAFHMCYDHPALNGLADNLAKAMEDHYLCRFRRHFGKFSMYEVHEVSRC